MVDAVCVDPERIQEIWPHISHFVLAAMKNGDLGRFVDVEKDILAGGALVWLAYDQPKIEAVAVTQISLSERGKVCTIVACGGGQFQRWVGLIGRIESYAKSEQCRAVRLMGRRGWKRVLKNYTVTKIILERPL